MPFFFGPIYAIAPDGDRVAIVDMEDSHAVASSFRVTVYDAAPLGAEGDVPARPVFERSYPFDPVPIPAEQVDSTVQARIEGAKQAFGSYADELRDLVPSIFAPFETIVLGRDGRSWIRLRATDEGSPWLVLDPDGDPAGQAILPANSTVHAADAAHVWTVERDTMGVQSVVRYQVRQRP